MQLTSIGKVGDSFKAQLIADNRNYGNENLAEEVQRMFLDDPLLPKEIAFTAFSVAKRDGKSGLQRTLDFLTAYLDAIYVGPKTSEDPGNFVRRTFNVAASRYGLNGLSTEIRNRVMQVWTGQSAHLIPKDQKKFATTGIPSRVAKILWEIIHYK